MISSLPPGKLKFKFDHKKLNCRSTEELTPLEGIIGQDRAVKALKFGLNIENGGFNIFVAGYSGTGRMTGVKNFVEELAKNKPIPSDWIYVNNFKNSYEPKAIKLPAGKGGVFAGNMNNFISSIRELLPKTFSSKDYTEKKESITRGSEEEKGKLLQDLRKKAHHQGFTLKTTQIGLFVVPAIAGKPMTEDQYMALSQQEKDDIQRKKTGINKALQKTMNQIRDLDRRISEETKKLNHEVALYTIGKFVNDIRQDYKNNPGIQEYMKEVEKDILNNINNFIPAKPSNGVMPAMFPWMRELPFKKYEVNVLVDNSGLSGAPVVIEQNPTHQNLFGRIEKEVQLGVLSTDFTMIHSGSLHKANNGFLVIPVEDLFKNIFSWDGLKMSLRDKKIIIEEASERLGIISTKWLKPEPIPLNIKVILIGIPHHYSILYNMDIDFKKLFKVKADYDLVMKRDKNNIEKYARFICTLCIKDNLNHLKSSSVARVLEYGIRLSGDQNKISTRFAEISNIITEANFYSKEQGKDYIEEDHIEKAIEEKYYRSNLIQEKIKEMIYDGTILIDTTGSIIGQVNGLSVINLGDYAFGRPSRVTVSVGMGKAGIIDIERETKLGGPIHTKGVMILSGYITEKYAVDRPLNLSARIVFEQSYGGVKGDSASGAELYAMLSALSGVPINQNLAVTGSVNQKGEVQAIGGVNEKIEGFFEICKSKGLNGKQGVLIPHSNIKNLMLKDEVIKAVEADNFHIYGVKTIDEGIEILTGVKAGKRGKTGKFPRNSINSEVDEKIKEFTDKLNKLSAQKEGSKDL
ncbi:MAG: ATP-binding protein [Actinomycetota bacterium]|nr:MAG: ATP-binding protein [Actinomycetota bacterium]